MKKIGSSLLFACAFSILATAQTNFTIQSFDQTGTLVFNQHTNATSYRVEWAPSPAGPWTNTWDGLDFMIPTDGTSAVTCSVAMCYRVIAELGIAMSEVPSGTNTGTDPDIGAYSITLPQTLLMDTTEITKSQWDVVYLWAVNHGYQFDNRGSALGDHYPVTEISCYDAIKWCNARSEKEGLNPCYSVTSSSSTYRTGAEPLTNLTVNSVSSGYRLPVYDEFRYAALGGSTGTRFPWGNEITHSDANYTSTTNNAYDISPTRGLHPVYNGMAPAGSFPPNGYGLRDILGNASEWHVSIFGNAIYGGGASSPASSLAVHYRHTVSGVNIVDGGSSTSFGFRCVRMKTPAP